MNHLINFIQENPNWRELLEAPPFSLLIKTDLDFPDLYLFKYNQYDSDMDNIICQEARGLILEIVGDTVKIVCHSFDKFFNYGEPQGQQVLEKFNWNDYSFQEKRDGSLMRLWFYNGKWNISTSGTIDAYKAEIQIPSCPYTSFGDMFNHIYLSKTEGTDDTTKLNPEYTYSFEMTSPNNKIVVDYTEDNLTFIGLRDNILNKELSPYKCNPFTNIECAPCYQFKSLEEALDEINSYENFEGLVLCDGNYNRVKIKTDEYSTLARLVDETSSDRGILKLILEDKIDDILYRLPHLQRRIDIIRDFIRTEVENIFRLYQQVDFTQDRKTIALQLKGNPYQGFVFKKLDDPSYDFVEDYFVVDNLEKIYRTYKEKVKISFERGEE